ncbi:molybdopterin dinucleotide binding domain-containing protein, partial [uncultured Parasutterella sp.]
DRGNVLAGAVVTDKVRKDVVLIRHGGWFEPQKQEDGSTLDVHGNANTLTMDVPTSKLACGNVASSGLVEVEKFEGDLPTVKIREETVPQPKA